MPAAGSPAQSASRRRSPAHGLLYPPPHPADDPDARRHHGHLVPGDPVRAGRADRTGHRQPAGRSRRRHGPGVRWRRRFRLRLERRQRQFRLSRRAGARPGLHRAARKAVRLRQAAAGALRHDAVELCPLRFRRQLFPLGLRLGPDPRKDAGVDLARLVDYAAVLSDLDPARHPQGADRRLALRRVDLRRRHRRLCDPRLPLRHFRCRCGSTPPASPATSSGR